MPVLPEVPDLPTYLRLHREPAAWAPAMEVLRSRHGLDGPAMPAEAGGNVVFALGARHFVKLLWPRWIAEYEAERAFLPLVAGRIGVATPEIVADGELEGWPYLVITRVPGDHVKDVWGTLPEADRLDVATSLGEAMARMNALPADGLPGGPWPAFVEACLEKSLARFARYAVPPAVVEGMRAALPRAGGGALVPIHADLTDDNVLVGRVGGRWRVTGILDFADARVGLRAYEMVAPGFLVTRGDPVLTRALLDAAGNTDDADTLAVWSLLHVFNELAFLPDDTFARFRDRWWPISG